MRMDISTWWLAPSWNSAIERACNVYDAADLSFSFAMEELLPEGEVLDDYTKRGPMLRIIHNTDDGPAG